MAAILWFFALVGCYAVFLFWRAKFALNTICKQNNQFRDARFEKKLLSDAKHKVRHFIVAQHSALEHLKFTSLLNFTNRSMGENFHAVYISDDKSTICEFTYMRMPLTVRFLMLVTSPKSAFAPDILCVCLETPYANGEVAITTTMERAPLPRWIHAKWASPETKLIELFLTHLQLRDSIESARGLSLRGIVDENDYFTKDAEHRDRLSRHMALDLEQMIRENNLEHLVNEK